MASEPVIGEGNDGVREKQIINVYKRKGKGQRKQTSLFALQASGVTDNSEKQEEKLENEKAINHVSLPESVARESVDTIVAAKNSVEDDALGTNFRVDDVAKNANEASSENVTELGSDKVIDKPLVEAFSQAESQDGVSLTAMDKNVMQPLPGSLCQDDANTIVGEKSEEVPFQSQKSRDDVNTVVVDENSIKEPLKSLGQGDVTTVIVDKNTIEAPSQTLSMGDTNTVVVDKNPIEVSSEEYVHVVDADNDTLTKKTHTENLAERDAQQPAGLTSDSAHTIPSTTAGIMPMAEGEGGRIRMHVASQSKQQKEETRKKLEDQLSLIRGLVQKIEDKEGEIGAYDDSRINNEGGRNVSEFASDGLTREVIRSPTPLSISLLENTHGVDEHLEKEKRTPKANQFYRTSEFLLGDKLPPAKTNKKSKSNAKKQRGEGGPGFGAGSKVFKNCSALLERLMKHKHGWVFNAPVDAKALGLHDYFTIIEHPMDLGTVKSRLTTNFYKSPRELAEDVRLTFRNAMIYNPKGQDVHVMAEQLLLIFEERYAVIEADYNREMRFVSAYETNLPATTMRSRLGPTMPPPPINVRNTVDRADWSRSHPKSSTTPGRTPTSTTPSGRTPALKKPKANEPNKRDMTYEEKQKLSGHLQNLPPDKLDAIVQIVNKRNTAVKLGDEEVEVDIDSVDPETLWELDRFVTNYKKGLSKKRRKAELALQARAEAERNNQLQMAPAPVANESSREGGTTAKKTLPAPLSSQVEKQNNETSRSSSSGSSSSGSSSTSDSDSDSSSSSGSDQA